MSPSLSVVADNGALPLAAQPKPPLSEPPLSETVAQRVRRLQAEARVLAKDHVRSLSAAMVELERLAAEVAEGGDAYAPGVRDLARRLAEDLDARAQTLDAIAGRT